MSGRRNQSRVTFANSSGVLRVSRDVIVEKVVGDELVAVGNEPGIEGDVLTIALSINQVRETVTVLVMASRPRLVNGGVKHELRLKRVDSHAKYGATRCGAVDRGTND
jgi:hypothetical protein